MTFSLDDINHLPQFRAGTMKWPPKVVEWADVTSHGSTSPSVGVVGVIDMYGHHQLLMYSADIREDGKIGDSVMVRTDELEGYVPKGVYESDNPVVE